jgi:hypothetical protein
MDFTITENIALPPMAKFVLQELQVRLAVGETCTRYYTISRGGLYR